MSDSTKKKGAGRPAGGKNKVEKPKGKQISIWLDPECLARLIRLKNGRSDGKTICAALKHLEENPPA